MFATDSGLKASANDAAAEDDAARLYVDSDADVNKKGCCLYLILTEHSRRLLTMLRSKHVFGCICHEYC